LLAPASYTSESPVAAVLIQRAFAVRWPLPRG
jgi:hypothetical protein